MHLELCYVSMHVVCKTTHYELHNVTNQALLSLLEKKLDPFEYLRNSIKFSINLIK